ncbi:MAG: AmmeMemoRadiSam system protein B [Candidatus Aminicenantes bacterium]|nr:AmmeMemoRadiSam system protein B [Candidatus Aminicenantes bacterium]
MKERIEAASGVALFGLFLALVFPCFGRMIEQIKDNDRKPAVAGTFYPDDPAELRQMVTAFLAAGKKGPLPGIVRALVVPHAGYVFSGGVAASGYNQIDADYPYARVFILASSHRVNLDKASVYVQGDYLTPLGTLEVDKEASASLAKKRACFTDDPDAHLEEHSIEVQLPFLQVRLKKPFKIVPIVLATQTPAVCREIAEALKPYFTKENLFIVSSDFSHFPSYEDARKTDAATAEAFCTNSTVRFLEALRANARLGIPDLATSMCAWPSALTLLYLTEGNTDLKFSRIDYQNSGDIKPYGDKSRVVGYQAIAVSEPVEHRFELTAADKKDLLRIARQAVDSAARSETYPALTPEAYGPTLKERAGAFVTLRVNGGLRGCLGMFEPLMPLYQVVQEMAVASATRDGRFPPVRPGELKDILIEVSVLTPMRKIKDIREIQLGKHGIYIQKGFQHGTFLPQVATETGWTLEEFLGHCAEEKAGIGWNGWKQADIYIYEAVVFEEPAR